MLAGPKEEPHMEKSQLVCWSPQGKTAMKQGTAPQASYLGPSWSQLTPNAFPTFVTRKMRTTHAKNSRNSIYTLGKAVLL